mmetsp:Transcript_20232/g.47362  ORF Transcript_20232/g.47362 Transcript_20232/m.47362 type:complete len:211 (+) Transcript_20232:301-933(+)
MRRDKQGAHLQERRADVDEHEEWVRQGTPSRTNSNYLEDKANGTWHGEADEYARCPRMLILAQQRRKSATWRQGLLVIWNELDVTTRRPPMHLLDGNLARAHITMGMQVRGYAGRLHGRKVAASTVHHRCKGSQLNETLHRMLKDETSTAADEHGHNHGRPPFSQNGVRVRVVESHLGAHQGERGKDEDHRHLQPLATLLRGPEDVGKDG